MGYGDVANRGLTATYGQYPGFRTENSVVASWLGRMPFWPIAISQTLLNEWDLGAVRLQKIAYHTEPGMSVRAYLLRPAAASAAPVPGILALHQHNDEYAAGKSEVVGLVDHADYPHLRAIPPEASPHPPSARVPFAYARELAERGYIVLAPDFLGFEEYRDQDEYYEDPAFIRLYEEMVSSKYLLYGSCLMAKHVHDVFVAISALGATQGVDPDRIGVIGHSLGGEVAAVAATLDSRIKAGVSSCGIVAYQHFEQSGRAESAETIIPGFRAAGYNFDFFLARIAPTPFLATYGLDEPGAAERQQMLSDSIEGLAFAGGHDFPTAVRQQCYAFLDHHLHHMSTTS
jgi:pimeloyl-ACP methyl ester carboxylesterase